MVYLPVSRTLWGAEEPTRSFSLQTPVPNIYITNTYTQMCFDLEKCSWVVKHLQHRHMKNNFKFDIKYNFLVGGDGKVYEGRGWFVQPDLPHRLADFNANSLYVAYVGEFKKFDVPARMQSVLRDFIIYGQENNYIDRNYFMENISNQFETYDAKATEKNLNNNKLE